MIKNGLLTVVSVLLVTSLTICMSAEAQGLPSEEQAFVKNAAMGGLAEVKLSQLANERASDMKVKDFASRMVTDHTQANNELKPIAESNKISVPSELEGESEMAYERLAKLSGAQFDKEYVKVMVQDHDKTVAQFEEASLKVKDPSLKAFIDKTLPILRQHKEHVHGLS
jgi:putative membrane protein